MILNSRRPPWSRLPPAQPTAKTSPRPRKLAWLREGWVQNNLLKILGKYPWKPSLANFLSDKNPPTGLQRPDGRLPEVHGGVEGGGGLGCLLLLLAVATSANIPRKCLHLAVVPQVQIFILTLIIVSTRSSICYIYMQTISNKYYLLTWPRLSSFHVQF